MEKDDFRAQSFGQNDHCLRCSCSNDEHDMPTMRRADELSEYTDALSSSSSNSLNKPKRQVSDPGGDNAALSFANGDIQ